MTSPCELLGYNAVMRQSWETCFKLSSERHVWDLACVNTGLLTIPGAILLTDSGQIEKVSVSISTE